jgi:hypothetical protein
MTAAAGVVRTLKRKPGHRADLNTSHLTLDSCTLAFPVLGIAAQVAPQQQQLCLTAQAVAAWERPRSQITTHRRAYKMCPFCLHALRQEGYTLARSFEAHRSRGARAPKLCKGAAMRTLPRLAHYYKEQCNRYVSRGVSVRSGAAWKTRWPTSYN